MAKIKRDKVILNQEESERLLEILSTPPKRMDDLDVTRGVTVDENEDGFVVTFLE